MPKDTSDNMSPHGREKEMGSVAAHVVAVVVIAARHLIHLPLATPQAPRTPQHSIKLAALSKRMKQTKKVQMKQKKKKLRVAACT